MVIMNTFKKLQLAFASIIIMFTGYSGYAIYQMDTLASATENIFQHPLAVGIAARNLNTEILQVNLLLSQHNNHNNNATIRQIETRRFAMQQEFDIINERYLGSEIDVKNILNQYNKFFKLAENIPSNPSVSDMHPIQGSRLNELNQVQADFFIANQVLIDFASNKAQNFLNTSTQARNLEKVLSLVFLLLFSIIITIYIIQNLIGVNKEVSKQLHLIDQNILMAELDPNGMIHNISHALCRALNSTVQEMTGSDSHFFIDEPEQLQQLKDILSSEKGAKMQIQKIILDEKVWFEMSIEPQFDQDFNINYFNLFLTDITSEKKIEEVSITDKLTGLYNRNYFEMFFSKEMRKAKRDKKLFGVILMDIDYFKQYNDTYGHLQGDYALKSVASMIDKNTQRAYDLAFRVGGEEFLIIFSVENNDQALAFANKIRTDIEALEIEHNSSSVSKFLTASFGVGVFAPSHLLNENEIYNQVDQQLYVAKNEGRNTAALISVE
jgi:diguanylate cyclase (GGDEF)-like protein/PAS domain S-box-containing protein